MNLIFTYFLYGAVAVLSVLSFIKDRKKTFRALKTAWKNFISVLPQFAAILLFAGLLLAILKPETIQSIVGAKSGMIGTLIASLVGSVALVPVLIVFPVVAELLKSGAGITQMAAFISTLTMVGVVTLPMESKYLGKKAALLRNLFAYLFSLAGACIIGVIVS